MKNRYGIFAIALGLSVIALGLSYAAFTIDPWTGEGDGAAGAKYITVPLALLSLPFLTGMTVAGAVMGNQGKEVLGFVVGGLCQYFFYLLITWAVVRKTPFFGRRNQVLHDSKTEE